MFIKEVSQGQHNYSSVLSELLPITGDFHRTMEVQFYTWYTPDILPVECREDWNKGGGIGNYLSLNNQSATMLGWRCTVEPSVWDVCIYINTSTKSFWTTSYIKVQAEDIVRLNFRKKNSSMDVSLSLNGKNQFTINVEKCARVMRKRNPWHGGQCPCPGPYCRMYHKWYDL